MPKNHARQPDRIPIIRRNRIWLYAFTAGNTRRFAQVFRNTWKRLPLYVRRLCVKYWRQDPSLEVPGYSQQTMNRGCCEVHLIPFCERPKHPKDKYLACCYDQGRLMCFCQPIVDLMPDETLASLIAHELGHVVFYAQGDNEQRGVEMMVDEMVGDWGFDQTLINLWCHRFLTKQKRLRKRPLPPDPDQEQQIRESWDGRM